MNAAGVIAGNLGTAGQSNSLNSTQHAPSFTLADTSRLDRPKLCLIVDTEADIDWAAPSSREAHHFRSIDGIRRVQQLFDRFAVKPTYLVDYPVATDPAAIRLLRNLPDQGRCEIGVQLHAWTTPPVNEFLCVPNSYVCDPSGQLQEARPASLPDAIVRAFAIGSEARTALELRRSLLPPGRSPAIAASMPPHGRPLPAAR
jgi:hypothetical protein